MSSCKELTRFVASDEFEDAPWRRRLGIRFHLLMCRHCRRYKDQLRTIAKSARRHLGGDADPETLERLERVILKRPSGQDLGESGSDKGG